MNPVEHRKYSGHDAIVIPAEVYVALELIRRSGKTNMLDRPAVQYWANRRNLYDAVCWLEEDRETYMQGVFTGFAPDRPLTDEEQDAIDDEGAV